MKVKFTILLATLLLLVTACNSGGIQRGGTLKHADWTRPDDLYNGYGYVAKNILLQFGTPTELDQTNRNESLLCYVKITISDTSFAYMWGEAQVSDTNVVIKPLVPVDGNGKFFPNTSDKSNFSPLHPDSLINCEIFDEGNTIKVTGSILYEGNSYSKKLDNLLVCMKYEPENSRPSTEPTP